MAWDDVLRLSNLSAKQVAERAEIKDVTVRGLLGGHHRASADTAVRLAEAVGVRVETLFPTFAPGVTEVDEAVAS